MIYIGQYQYIKGYYLCTDYETYHYMSSSGKRVWFNRVYGSLSVKKIPTAKIAKLYTILQG